MIFVLHGESEEGLGLNAFQRAFFESWLLDRPLKTTLRIDRRETSITKVLTCASPQLCIRTDIVKVLGSNTFISEIQLLTI